jgi:hypothetical protein
VSEPRLAGRLIVPVLVSLLAAALAWAVGLDGGHLVLVAVAVLLTGGASRALAGGAPPDWPEVPDETSGTGCHLVQLQARIISDSEADADRFERSLAARLRLLTAARLHAAGYRTAGPAVREMLGPALFDPLRPGSAPRRPVAYLGRLLDRLDEIDPPDRRDFRG